MRRVDRDRSPETERKRIGGELGRGRKREKERERRKQRGRGRERERQRHRGVILTMDHIACLK